MTSAKAALDLAERIKPLLAGHGSKVQGAALAELTAIWLAGHIFPAAPAALEAELRADLLRLHYDAVSKLAAVELLHRACD